MPKPLKVYGWTGWRTECRPAPNGSRQTREVVAARSWNEVSRITGKPLSELRWQGNITGNAGEVEIAMSKPGKVFWQPLDARSNNWIEVKS